MPGFTEHSQVPKMFAAAGLPYPELVDLLVTDALADQAPNESHRSYLPGQADIRQ
jgi:D-ala D-ala ligase C-terminus